MLFNCLDYTQNVYVLFLFWCFLVLHETHLALKTWKKIGIISYQTHEKAKNQGGYDENGIRTPSRNSKSYREIVVKML